MDESSSPRRDRSDPGAEPVVRTAALTKRFGDRTAVDAVSMTVRRGEVYGFLGPNGAGKTTTLRMLVGLVRATSGRAEVLGQRVGATRPGRRVGALIEGPGFFPYLSGRDNLRVMATYAGLPAAAAERALERVDLAGRGADRFRSYSLGMKQRLGVAAALMGDPELVVLDEPSNGLDPAGMADMRALIADLAQDGRTVLLSSHLLAEVQQVCDRVGVIHQGRLLRESTVAELRGVSSLRVRAYPVEGALAVAMGLAGDDGVHLVEDRVVVDLPEDQAPALTRALVAAGLEIHEVTSRERSLEEVFFEMTATATGPVLEEEAAR